MSDRFLDWGHMKVGIEKPEKEPANVDEMRQAMERARPDVSIIHNVFDVAEYNGMRGEDKYAMLAYHALRRVEEQHKQILQMFNTIPSTPIVIKAETG